jgi:hypothetical protein
MNLKVGQKIRFHDEPGTVYTVIYVSPTGKTAKVESNFSRFNTLKETVTRRKDGNYRIIGCRNNWTFGLVMPIK